MTIDGIKFIVFASGITSTTRGFVNNFRFEPRRILFSGESDGTSDSKITSKVSYRFRTIFFLSPLGTRKRLFRFFFKQRLWLLISIRRFFLHLRIKIHWKPPLRDCLDSQLFGRRSDARASIYSGRAKVTRETTTSSLATSHSRRDSLSSFSQDWRGFQRSRKLFKMISLLDDSLIHGHSDKWSATVGLERPRKYHSRFGWNNRVDSS